MRQNTIIVSGLKQLYTYLLTGAVINNIYHCCDKVIIMNRLFDNNYNSMRMWKSNTIFDIWYSEMTSNGYNNFIAALDYTIEDKHIKIDYLNINDIDTHNLFHNEQYFDEYEAIHMTNCLLTYMENIARSLSKEKIVIDVHENLRLYNKFYKGAGFVLTTRRASDNPFWLQVEKNII